MISFNPLSSLTRRIISLNIAALLLFCAGVIYLNQFRKGLIDARVESLLIQGKIISAAIAASATVETDAITFDPKKLLELQAGEKIFPYSDVLEELDFPINPEIIAPVLRSLISPSHTRARIYDRQGFPILDSRHIYSRGQIMRYSLPPLPPKKPGIWERSIKFVNLWLQRTDFPVYEEIIGNGTGYSEVAHALSTGPRTVVRNTKEGELIVSAAVPIQRFRSIYGVLLLSTQGKEINEIMQAERMAIVQLFIVACVVSGLLSLLLASTIAVPLKKLSEAAIRVRQKSKSREEIPDFSKRQDEIGILSTSLREMTGALYNRIEAIENFAADVSHELKNPLTSLRSAIETLPLAKENTNQEKLLDIIQKDVIRLDRLITDIADISRLDADLARLEEYPVDLCELITNVVRTINELYDSKNGVDITFTKEYTPRSKSNLTIFGHEMRLGQVIHNLIDNAYSFVSKTDGKIAVSLSYQKKYAIILIEDNGSGISQMNRKKIFERFYKDRPGIESFGRNSGLGLSISKQIIEAHGGSIDVLKSGEYKTTRSLEGARFIIKLPI